MIPPDVIDELYGVELDEFVPTRTRLARVAREGGDRDLASLIGELRKPTVAAWAINRLVRERPAEIDRLVELGERMRTAQAGLDVASMRELRPERDATLEAFTRAARFVADGHDHGLSVAAASAVRTTGVAALADEKAAEAVASGALVRTLEYAGLGEVDLADAAASWTPRRPAGADGDTSPPDSPPAARTTRTGRPRAAEPDPAHARRRGKLEEEVAAADQELARASLVVAERERQAQKAGTRVAELTRLLDAAQEDERSHVAAVEEAVQDRGAASEAYELARRRLTEFDAAGN